MMEHSKFFKSIKMYYDTNRYSKEDVKVFVRVAWITEEEYKEITGDIYET